MINDPLVTFLSYPIDKKTPVYPGDTPVFVNKARQIRKGDSCNTSIIKLSSHAGTHMDPPYHFFEEGKRVGEYLPDELIFKKPHLICCPKRFNEAIKPADFKGSGNKRKADILLIKTGFGKYRANRPESYCRRNPYLSSEAAEYIIKNYPDVRAVGIDTVSISSKIVGSSGRESHRILLGNGVIIIEDMLFPNEIKRINEIAVFPVFAGCPDGSPCVIMGFKRD